MLLVEIALSGLKGLPEVRLTPKKGVNLLRMPNPDQRRQFIDALFFALQVDAGNGGHLADPGAKSARVALGIQGKDGQTYRLLRDLASGGTRLLKRAKDPAEWTTLSADLAEISQFMRVQLHVPDHNAYERVFVLAPNKLVGRGPAAESRAGGQLWPHMDMMDSTGVGNTGFTSAGFANPFLNNPGLMGTGPGFGTSPGFGSSSSGLGGNLGFGAPPPGPSIMRMQSALQPSPAFAPQGAPAVSDPHGGFGGQNPGSHTMSGVYNPNNALSRTEAEPPRAYDVEGGKRELARLTKHLGLISGSQAMRAELDRLVRYREQLKERVGESRAILEEAEAAREQAAQYDHLSSVPAGMADRIKDLGSAGTRRDKEMERVSEEREDVEKAIANAVAKPLQEDPMFLAGVAVLVLSIVCAISFGKAAIMLFNLVGAVIAAAAALSHVAVLERKGRLAGRLTGLDEKQAKVARQYELETGVVRKLLAQLNITDPEEMLEQLDSAAQASAERAAAENRAAEVQADPARRAELDDIAKVESRVEQIEAQLSTIDNAGDSTSVHEIEARIAEIRRELVANGVVSEPDTTAATTTGGARGGGRSGMKADDEGYGAPSMSAPGACEDDGELWASGEGAGWGGSKLRGGGDDGGPPPEDGTAALGAALADVVHKPQSALSQALLPRLSQYLKAFTQGRFTGAEIGPAGEIRVKPDASSAASPLGAVEPSLMRAVEAAIHLSWLEAAISRVAMPILVDDPFIGLSASARKLIGQSFGYMGDRSQVIIVTSESDLPGQPLT